VATCLCEEHQPTERRGSLLDWSQFANGRWWRLRRGEDHDQTPRKALQSARMWAKRNGMLAEAELPAVGEDDEPWAIRFYPRPDGSGR
jgi:hypothetical protein